MHLGPLSDKLAQRTLSASLPLGLLSRGISVGLRARKPSRTARAGMVSVVSPFPSALTAEGPRHCCLDSRTGNLFNVSID